MKIGISQLRKIIMEEAKLLTEGCGDGMIADDPCPACEADESSPCDAHAEHNYDDLSTLKSDDNDMLDKEEALGAVVSIATKHFLSCYSPGTAWCCRRSLNLRMMIMNMRVA